jgi:hypothetical protein
VNQDTLFPVTMAVLYLTLVTMFIVLSVVRNR